MVESMFVDSSAAPRLEPPIGVLASLMTGFDRVAARPLLLLPPLALDLFLWLGPRLRISALTAAVAAGLAAPAGADPGLVEQSTLLRQALTELGARLNLFAGLSSLPVGVPSLMASRQPAVSPLGPALGADLGEPLAAGLAWLALTVLGLGLGSLYHLWISRQVPGPSRAASLASTWARTAALSIAVYLLAFAASLVTLLVSGFVALAVPWLAMVLMFIGFSVLFWTAVYLMFSPHGIVRYGLGVWQAVRESVQLVRWNLLATSVFLMLGLLLSWATNWVWRLPGEDSWFSVLAVLGHAFVSATLLAASYVFYQGRRDWTRRALERITARQAPPAGA